MRSWTVLALSAMMACAPPDEDPSSFLGDPIAGAFVADGSTVRYDARQLTEDASALTLEVNGMQIDVELDRATETLTEDGHLDALAQADIDALLALRDALGSPERMALPHGELLLRHLDWLADAPADLVLGYHVIERATTGRFRSATCNDDGLTCLAGTNGTATAYYDKSGGACTLVTNQTYGTNQGWCRGRCGAGCPGWWFPDDDYTQDCFDHDTCVDKLGAGNLGNDPNCGDEFWEAADDYVATFFDAC